MAIHSGHRARLRARFLEHGPENFEDHEILELLLCYALPRQDVNPLAHTLLEAFDGLDGVFGATHEELSRVPGVGDSAALLIKLIPQICRRYTLSRTRRQRILKDVEQLGDYLMPYFLFENDEVAYLLCLDAARKPQSCRLLSRGVVNSVEISVRKVVQTALAAKASAVVLAHNHVSGIALPSSEDELSTAKMYDALQAVGIEMADHIIVAGNDFVSMAECGLLCKGKETVLP